jgi:hypothetical protein
MGAVEQSPAERATRTLRVAYHRAEELLADHLRYFREGRLPSSDARAERLVLRLEVAEGPVLELVAQRTPEGAWHLHPEGEAQRAAFETAVETLAVRTLGAVWAARLLAVR